MSKRCIWSALRLTTVAVSTLATTNLTAQEVRVPVPDPATSKKTQQGPAPIPNGYFAEAPPVTVRPSDIRMNADLGDEPDFRRAVDVLDEHGYVVGIKHVGNPYTLSFTSGDFEPKPGIDPRLRETLSRKEFTYGFVMIRGRMSDAKMDRLKRLGLQLLDVHTYQSVKARIPAHTMDELQRLPFVYWVGFAKKHQKIDHNLVGALANAKDEDLVQVIINPFVKDTCDETKIVVDGEKAQLSKRLVDVVSATSTRVIPNGPIHQRLVEEFGFEFSHYNEIIHNFEGAMTKANVLRLLEEDWVDTVERFEGKPEPDHDQAIPMVRQDLVRRTYDGKGVACGFIDSGLDATPWHQDFYGKNFVSHSNATNPISDHGTHVAGTIWGSGRANARFKGACPGAGTGGEGNRIFIGMRTTSLSTNATSFGRNFTWAGRVNPYPRVISNSYSWKDANGYYGSESNARTIDAASYDRRQLWVFSSGNKKATPDNFWCGSPSSGKNVLTCGAVSDTFNSVRTLNPGNRPWWSRWGVRDYRTKPDVVAPGDITTSTAWNSSSAYVSYSGTSMSTPLVSGTMISRIQAQSWYNDKPEALRARAVASAKNDNRLSPGVSAEPQSGKGSRQTTGWGLINARTMVYSSAESQAYIWAGAFTATGQGYTSAEVRIPSDAQYVRMVLVITEPAASSGATRARRNDVRAFFDAFPYRSGNNTGDIGAYSSLQTVMVRDIFVRSLDKRVRIKAYAQSVVASQARWALCMQVYRKVPNVIPTVSSSGLTIVRPNTNYQLTATMRSPSTSDQFHAGRLSYEGAFPILSMVRTTEDPFSQWYYPTNTHASNPYPRVGSGLGFGMTVGSGTLRQLIYNLRSPASSGRYTLRVYGTYSTTTSPAPVIGASRVVCVDGLPPRTVTGLRSTTHTPGAWSNRTSFTAIWDAGVDNGCAGIKGYGYRMTLGSAAPPLGFLSTSRTKSYTLSNTSSGYYFSVKNVDRNNYLSTTNVAIGPFKIDTTKPVISSVSLNNGATYTSSPTVSVRVVATDAYSGLHQMRFSGNNSTWTPWRTFSTAPQTIGMAAYGWTTEGVRTVYVQVRDRARNVSGTGSDTIRWLRAPKIATAAIATLPNVTRGYYRFTGSDFLGTTRVRFGSSTITDQWTNNHDDWWNGGAFFVVSETELRVYPPQGAVPGTYGVRVGNSVYWSNTVNVKVTTQPGRILYTNSLPTAGKPFTIMMAQSSEAASTPGLIVVSPVKSPSVLPGVVSLEIGLNFTAYEIVTRLPFDPTTKAIKLTFPTSTSYRGATGWFEGVYMRPTTPLPTTNAWQTRLN